MSGQSLPIAQGSRASNAELVERLFREHNEALVRFLLARLRSRQAALEVAQEAYVRLLSLDEPGAVSYLRSFLFKTAANLAVDRMRRDDVHARATETPLFHEFADARTPERVVAGAQEMKKLTSLVDALPPKCRRAFILNRFYGLDLSVVAAQMGLSERMVRTYVVRALLYCRSNIGAKYE
ncbi:MAG TPA: sigma-70 family RNA polymerase sigma factor [Steroidobacteraceae bacterium]|jgi:RNA polymerase sigma-70 factor (ECF subfamily)